MDNKKISLIFFFSLILIWSLWGMAYEWQVTFGVGQGTNNALIPPCINDGDCVNSAGGVIAPALPQANENGYEGWEMLCNFSDGVTSMHCANGLDYVEKQAQ